MAAEAKVREMFDAIDTSGDGFISSSELGTAFRRMGMNPTRSDVVLALRELDANGDGRVSFAEFVRYYKRFSERYGGSKFNRLLVKDLVGHTRKSGYDLPPEGHAYGKKVRADPEGAGQVVLHWKSGSPSKARRPARDLVAMNARAAASGCTTAAEIRAFHRGNVAYQKTFKPAKREMAAVDVVYGQKNRPSTPIGVLIQGKYGQMDEEEADYPRQTAAAARHARVKAAAAQRGPGGSAAGGSGSIGTGGGGGGGGSAGGRGGSAARKEHKEPFKMKKFKNVRSRVFDGVFDKRAPSGRSEPRSAGARVGARVDADLEEELDVREEAADLIDEAEARHE